MEHLRRHVGAVAEEEQQRELEGRVASQVDALQQQRARRRDGDADRQRADGDEKKLPCNGHVTETRTNCIRGGTTLPSTEGRHRLMMVSCGDDGWATRLTMARTNADHTWATPMRKAAGCCRQGSPHVRDRRLKRACRSRTVACSVQVTHAPRRMTGGASKGCAPARSPPHRSAPIRLGARQDTPAWPRIRLAPMAT